MYPVSLPMEVLAEAFCPGKANSYLQQVFIPVRAKYCPFYDESSPM